MDRAKSALSINDIILSSTPRQNTSESNKMGNSELKELRKYFEDSRAELEKVFYYL